MDQSWLEAVGDELETPAMQGLRAFLAAEVAAGRGFFPPGRLVFNALRLTPLDDVRVVILGQDPYHGRGQAMGLSFSVPAGVPPPPSLRNIFTELGTDLGLPVSRRRRPHALGRARRAPAQQRAHRGPGSPASHAGKGWEAFTDRVIAELSARREGIVFLLWGRYAQQKGAIVDTSAPPRAHRRSPLAVLGEQRLLRLPPLLAGERAARARGPAPGRLGLLA